MRRNISHDSMRATNIVTGKVKGVPDAELDKVLAPGYWLKFTTEAGGICAA